MTQEIFNRIWLVLLIIILIVRKIHERKAGKQFSLKGTPIVEVTLMALWGVAAAVLPFFYIFSNWLNLANYPFKMSSIFGFVGAILFLFSIWLLHRSHTDLGKMWSMTVEPNSEKKLVTNGVYKRIRHPMYSAHLLWGIAQFLLLPNLIAGPLALLIFFTVIKLRIPREERAMIKEFGDNYRNYVMQTGRILPKLSIY